MSGPTISIIGAGISGLTVARCLSKRGLQVVLYDRATADQASKRHNHGITLNSWAYQPLLKDLDLDETSFRHALAIEGNHIVEPTSIRANRLKFEQWLREGLDVKWEHKFEDVKTTEQPGTGTDLMMRFNDGHEARTGIMIAADGAHSQVRKLVAPSVNFKVLPFAVYNGKRRVSRSTFEERYAAAFDGADVIEHKIGSSLLQISVNGQTDDQVSVSYTYSRPARQPDQIFNPKRSNAEATIIPDDLFDEIRGLGDLKSPFRDVFDAGTMKHDRLLNWLMRSALVGFDELDIASKSGIIFLGESSHLEPILGGQGANLAIQDAIELAEYITEPMNTGGYYEKRHHLWKNGVDRSEAQLAEMHREERPHL